LTGLIQKHRSLSEYYDEYYDGERIGNETKKFKYDFNNESEDEDLLNFLKTCKY
jgi:hypothetical protein